MASVALNLVLLIFIFADQNLAKAHLCINQHNDFVTTEQKSFYTVERTVQVVNYESFSSFSIRTESGLFESLNQPCFTHKLRYEQPYLLAVDQPIQKTPEMASLSPELPTASGIRSQINSEKVEPIKEKVSKVQELKLKLAQTEIELLKAKLQLLESQNVLKTLPKTEDSEEIEFEKEKHLKENKKGKKNKKKNKNKRK